MSSGRPSERCDERSKFCRESAETRPAARPDAIREDQLTDYFPEEEEFAPIAKAMKDLPYFAPSPQFADKVMAHVRIQGALQVPTIADQRAIQPQWSAPIDSRARAQPAPGGMPPRNAPPPPWSLNPACVARFPPASLLRLSWQPSE